MEITEFQEILTEKAIKNGFEDCEIYFEYGKTFEAAIYEGEIARYENSTQMGISFRGKYNGNMGYAYSEEISENAVEFIINKAKENASVIEDNDKEELYTGDMYTEDLCIFNEQLHEFSDSDKIKLAKDMEVYAKSADNKISSVDDCLIAYEESNISIVNTKGLNASYKTNALFAYVSSIAKQGESIKMGSEYFSGRNLRDFSAEKIGKTASENAVKHLNACSVPSGRYTVVFDPEAMNDMLSTFAGIFFAENVQKGFSLLKDKTNKKIASDILTIYDNAILKGGLGTVPFDSEGVKGQNKVIIENGILKTLLYNLKSAARDGVASTGNGFKSGFKAPVATNITNFYIKQGNLSRSEIIESIKSGIVITEIAGLHSGANTISGDFSFSAEGFLIENGKIVNPVEQITVAGNFYNALKNIEAIGNNLKFSLSGKVGCPSVSIGNISVSGE